MGLSRKRKVFVEEYLQCWNATEAARKAGYSERSIRSIASEILTIPDVQAYIRERLDQLQMSSDEVLKRISDIGRASPETFLTFDGSTWKIDIPKAKREGKLHLIKSITPTANGIKVELHDPMRALELIGKHKQLFTEKTIQVHEGTITHKIEDLDLIIGKVYGADEGNEDQS